MAGCQSLASTASDNRMNVELSLHFALVVFLRLKGGRALKTAHAGDKGPRDPISRRIEGKRPSETTEVSTLEIFAKMALNILLDLSLTAYSPSRCSRRGESKKN